MACKSHVERAFKKNIQTHSPAPSLDDIKELGAGQLRDFVEKYFAIHSIEIYVVARKLSATTFYSNSGTKMLFQ